MTLKNNNMDNHNVINALHMWANDTFDYMCWKNFGYELNCTDEIETRERLLRSLHFEDDNYSSEVYRFFEYMCGDDDFVKRAMKHEPFKKWLKDSDPNLYDKIYVNDVIVLDDLKDIPQFNDLKDIPQLDKEITRIKKALIDDDSESVIGYTKDLLEKIFKIILDDHNVNYNNDNVQTLYKKTCSVLKLDLDDDYNNSFKKIFGGCSTIVNEICYLRNKFGIGHGNPKSISLPRGYQILFINSAATICTFLIDNWQKNKH